MKKTALVITLALVLPLAACGDGSRGTNPLDDETTTATDASDLLTVREEGDGWVIDGAHFVGVDEETGDIVVKVNDEFTAQPSGPGTVTMTFRAIAPDSGEVRWEASAPVGMTFIMYDFEPWPPVPSHKTPPQVGRYVNVSGGATGPTSTPGSGVELTFPGPYLDVTTGEFVDSPAGGVSGTPYLTRFVAWDDTTLALGDEEFETIGTIGTNVRTPDALVLTGDLSFLGGDLLLRADAEARPFTVTFLDAETMKTTEVEMPEEWYPHPRSVSFAQFEDNLTAIPLADGVLWNIVGPEWLVVSPDGIEKSSPSRAIFTSRIRRREAPTRRSTSSSPRWTTSPEFPARPSSPRPSPCSS